MFPPAEADRHTDAMAMAMMAQTEDSRPMENPASTVVAGPVRADSAISFTGPRSVEVNSS